MRKMLLTAAVLASASAAAAQPAPPIDQLAPTRGEREAHEQTLRERPLRRPRLFVSPSGEPFRDADGLATWFAQADADHDGAISPAEFQADALRAFRLYDNDNDGVIDGFEIQAYERQRVPEILDVDTGPERGGGRGMFGRRRGRRDGIDGGDAQAQPARQVFQGAGREGASRFSLLNEPEPLLAADSNVDGRISLAEWKRATDRRFAALDKGHAGKLTLDALRPAKK